MQIPTVGAILPKMTKVAGCLIALLIAVPGFGLDGASEDIVPMDRSNTSSEMDEDDLTPSKPSPGAARTASSQEEPVAAIRASVAGVKAAASAAQAAATPPARAAKPQAVAAKLAIRDALARGDTPVAERLFMEALDRFPNDRDLRLIRNVQTLKLHDEKTKAIFDRTLTDSRKLFGRQWMPGESPGDAEWSIELEKSSRGRPGSSARALSDGYVLLDQGDPRRAEKVLTGAIQKAPGAAPLYYARAQARGMIGNLKGADDDSLKAVALSREQPATLSQRALLMLQSGRRDEAFAWADRALTSDPADADALAVRGRILWRDRGRYDLALEDLKQAARVSPERYGRLYEEAKTRFFGQRAAGALGKGDDRRALENANLALASNAGDATAHMVRGAVFFRAGNPEEAIKETTLALKADRRSGEALLYRGIALETLGQRDRALADFRRAADIDPARFRRFYERLAMAQRDGAPPLWSRKGAVAVPE